VPRLVVAIVARWWEQSNLSFLGYSSRFPCFLGQKIKESGEDKVENVCVENGRLAPVISTGNVLEHPSVFNLSSS
jgi:hypothetical protein